MEYGAARLVTDPIWSFENAAAVVMLGVPTVVGIVPAGHEVVAVVIREFD